MDRSPQHIHALSRWLNEIDGCSYQRYQSLLNRTFYCDRFTIRFIHIQKSCGAFPASVVHLILDRKQLAIDDLSLCNPARSTATADYLLRAFGQGVRLHARQNRGAQGSGSYQPVEMPPQVLERNLVHFNEGQTRIVFTISLPGSPDNRTLGVQAAQMFDRELDRIVLSLKEAIAPNAQLKKHCDVVEDMIDLQGRLGHYNLMAFVGDGVVLPRQSGVSQLPLKKGGVALQAPDSLAVEVDLPNAGRIRGLGIRPGVNVIIGGAYHGKSTLLNALAMGVYPHIPGDGRERVVSHPGTVLICAEEGRAVTGLNISGFVDNLPSGVDTRHFRTDNASGSTSQAAATVEALQAGAKLLLFDEDTSAANFLAKDAHMRSLLPEDTVTPLLDRVDELYRLWGVSTLLVLGGSSAYLGTADRVTAMRHYQPEDVTQRAKQLGLDPPDTPGRPLNLDDRRRVLDGNFDPTYHAHRLGKIIAQRIKPLRLQPKILEYGDQQLDLTCLDALVDTHQVTAIGYAMLQARTWCTNDGLSPSQLSEKIDKILNEQGLDALLSDTGAHAPLARPRRLELAAAINRLRDLCIDIAGN